VDIVRGVKARHSIEGAEMSYRGTGAATVIAWPEEEVIKTLQTTKPQVD